MHTIHSYFEAWAVYLSPLLLSLSLSIYLCIYLSISLYIYLSIYLTIYHITIENARTYFFNKLIILAPLSPSLSPSFSLPLFLSLSLSPPPWLQNVLIINSWRMIKDNRNILKHIIFSKDCINCKIFVFHLLFILIDVQKIFKIIIFIAKLHFNFCKSCL